MHRYTDNSNLSDARSHGASTLMGRPSYVTAYHPSHLGRLLKPVLQPVGQGLMHWLTGGTMPQVSKEIQGNTEVWKVYDPAAHRTRVFDDIDGLRVWMEARYYQ
jgi:hypothetical protein